MKSVQGNFDLLDWQSYQLEENCGAPPLPWPPLYHGEAGHHASG